MRMHNYFQHNLGALAYFIECWLGNGFMAAPIGPLCSEDILAPECDDLVLSGVCGEVATRTLGQGMVKRNQIAS